MVKHFYGYGVSDTKRLAWVQDKIYIIRDIDNTVLLIHKPDKRN